jgi:hypothetical protein
LLHGVVIDSFTASKSRRSVLANWAVNRNPETVAESIHVFSLSASRPTLMDLSGTVRKEEMAMEPLLAADQPDEGKILAQIDRLAQARAELEKANARMFLGLRRVLHSGTVEDASGQKRPTDIILSSGKGREATPVRVDAAPGA